MSTPATETSQPGSSSEPRLNHIPGEAHSGENARQNGSRDLELALRTSEEEKAALEQSVEEMRGEQQQLLERYIGLEEQNSALTALYVTCQSLHSSLDRGEILLTAREIIANLIGCEEYVLFGVAPDGSLVRVDSFGINPETYERLPRATGIIGRVATTGEIWQAEAGGAGIASGLEANLTACIPLKRNGAVMGVIALFRLLPQKFELQNLDQELFHLLETHLAQALHCSQLEQDACSRNGVRA